MRNILPFLLLLLFFSSSCHRKKHSAADGKMFTFSGTVYEILDYCGGVYPDSAQIHPSAQPSGAMKLVVRNGSANSNAVAVDTIRVGTDGKFSISLPKGNYCIVEMTKAGDYKPPVDDKWNTYDTACYHSHWNECDYSLALDKDVTDAKITFQRHCRWRLPCDSYSGPLPPVAHPHNE